MPVSRRRLVASHQFEIIRPGKGEVSAYGLKGAVLLLEVLRRIRCIRFARFAGFWVFLDNPHQLLRLREKAKDAAGLCSLR